MAGEGQQPALLTTSPDCCHAARLGVPRCREACVRLGCRLVRRIHLEGGNAARGSRRYCSYIGPTGVHIDESCAQQGWYGGSLVRTEGFGKLCAEGITMLVPLLTAHSCDAQRGWTQAAHVQQLQGGTTVHYG